MKETQQSEFQCDMERPSYNLEQFTKEQESLKESKRKKNIKHDQ